jgi:Ca2+-transporting ATPase
METHFPLRGLTLDQAQARLLQDGPNELRGSSGRTFWHLALDVLKEPMFLLLVACGFLIGCWAIDKKR